MNHSQILKRAWSILWSYKVLWIFGILLAITAGGGNPSNNLNYRNSARDIQSGQFNLPPEIQRDFRGLENLFRPEMVSFWIGLVITLVCLALLIGVIFAIVKYVSHTALIRMVDEHETTGEKVGFRQGWRWGWSRSAWRLFLIDLVIFIPLVLIFILLFGCAALPVILAAAGSRGEPGAAAILSTIGMAFLGLFFLFVVGVAVSLVINLIYRACVMEGTGVIDSIRLGVRRLRERFKDVFVMWLILIGVHIGYAIVLIPVVLLLLSIGLALGGGIGLATYFGLNAIASQTAAIITAVVVGFLLFFAILGLPLTFLEGLRQTYYSTTWTLVYRELKTVQPVEAGEAIEALPPTSGEASQAPGDDAAAGAAA